jgi:uncharacterized protein
MLLDLTHIRQPETPFERTYEPSAFAGGEEFRVTGPVVLRMMVHKDHDRFRLAGSVATTLTLECSRCLEPFPLPVDAAFDLRYLPQATSAAVVPVARDQEARDADVALSFYRNDAIDLSELLQEQFYLSLPMKPLCRPDCRGLCPVCGVNLNLASCSCRPQWEDPRLAGLRALMTERKHHDA